MLWFFKETGLFANSCRQLLRDAMDTECLKQLEGVKTQDRRTMNAGSHTCEDLEFLHAQLIACSACNGTRQGMEFHNKVSILLPCFPDLLH